MSNESYIPKNRLEAFSDGVIAIIITIMVLEIKAPHGNDLSALIPVIPALLCYTLSFLYIGIYWNNHHHLLHAAKHINGKIMWANLALLFWLSLFPFVTGWLGENQGGPWPSVLYGTILLFAAISYFVLQNLIIDSHGKDSAMAKAINKDWKGKLSLASYTAGILLSFISHVLANTLYISVAILWLIPDKRIEKLIGK